MNAFSTIMENKIVPVANKFSKISFMIVLRNASMSIMPLMIVGAIGTLLTNLPFESLAKLVEPTNTFFTALTTVTSNIAGLVMAISIGYFSAQHYRVDPLFGMVTALSAFLAATLTPELTIDTANFSATGIFTAIIVGFLSIYIVYICKKYKIEIKMPEGVPPMVASSFSTILSLAISVLLVLGIRIGFNLDLNASITNLLSPIAIGLNSLPGLIVYSFFGSLLFACGINPAVILGFLIPIFALNSEANAAAVAAGLQPNGFVTWGIYTFMCYGGTGATLGLVILMLRSKVESYQVLGKIGIVPSLFNINEPIIYGFPIIFNPIMLIPFIFTPIINISLSYLLMQLNIIGRPWVEIPWATPPIFNGFLMTGGDVKAAIWSGLLVLISIACYYPFFKIAEKQALLNQEEIKEGANN